MNEKQTDVNAGLPDIRRNVSLRPYNTLRVEAVAEKFVVVRRAEQLHQLWSAGLFEEDLLVLGGGSNILFRDRVNCLVLKNEIEFREIADEDQGQIHLKVGSGVNWHHLVQWCVENDLAGVENLALIPGTVGAAPVQNIGAYGVELKDCFISLQAFDLKAGEIHTFHLEDCRFGYRDSIFKHEHKGRFMITSVNLRLTKPPHVLSQDYQSLKEWLEAKKIEHPVLEDIFRGVVEIRTRKLPDPADTGNAGSFFKNPVVENGFLENLKTRYTDVPFYSLENGLVKIPAGWLIEKTGWKGRRTGRVGTYENQALVIVNHGGATGDEIWALSLKIGESVKEKFGVELVPEVNIIGSSR